LKLFELFDRHKLPAFHDPFAGGGALPLEAQRLGLVSCASDLNPVAVLINKAMIEIPPKFAGKPPVNPEARKKMGHSGSWKGAQGLAEDVRYYGQWMRDEAEKRIGHLYPKVKITTAPVSFLKLVTGQQSGPVMFMTGKWDATGKVMTWSGTMVDPMTNKPAKFTQKVTVVDNDHHNWEMWGPDMTGKNYKMMEASYTRSK